MLETAKTLFQRELCDLQGLVPLFYRLYFGNLSSPYYLSDEVFHDKLMLLALLTKAGHIYGWI